MLPRLMGAFLVGAMLPVLAGWALLGLLPGALWLLWRGHWPLLSLLLAGMAWTTSAVHQVNQMRLIAPTSFAQEQVTIERCWQSDWSRRCLLSNSDGQRYYLTWQADAKPEPGLTGIASGRLQPWSATVSPGQTSFALWLLRHRIAARGQVEQFHPDRPTGLSAWQLNTRRWLRERTVPSEARGFYEALVLGDRSALDSTVRGQVSRTQTQHLLALSGLHIGSLALWAYLIAGLLWRLYPVGVRQDWQKMAALLMAGLLLWIALPAVSLWRAFLMTLIPGVAWLIRRQFAAHNLLLLMGCLMVLGDPLIWLDLGAWFSWWATLVLIMLVRQIGHWPGWRQLVGIQAALSVLLVPVHALW
ncbi:MAG: ComEC/Rec2 family competence protein, partial [Natronospirillum sp.]|uniref:ComEC/Rec2 family competence protein n=1 Tax=Natronospirillum sp. TaxID=2812955 RepID=UPI0025EC6730